MWKKCKVVMLSTNEKVTDIFKCYNNSLSYKNGDLSDGGKYQHLYIISDEEIKEDDWYLNFDIHGKWGFPTKADYNKTNEFSLKPYSNYCKKIIATTDQSLKLKEFTGVVDESNGTKEFWEYLLPQIPQSFIEQYITEYNKCNVISNILVEYNFLGKDECKFDGSLIVKKMNNKCSDCKILSGSCDCNLEILKTNQDNTINIKTVKDSFNREEVIEFGNKIREYCKNGYKEDSLHKVFYEWDKFIEVNLLK